MPIITAFPDEANARVRVEIDWADIPAVEYAGVSRYNTVTGECVPLRPYICYDGWQILLSCGHGIFYDTEAPLDTEFYYITTSTQAPCLPQTILASDSFSRVLANSWGTTEGGVLGPLTYNLAGGVVPANYDVNGAEGTHTINDTNVFRYSTIDIGQPDFDLYIDVAVPFTAVGAGIANRAVGRFTDVLNLYFGGPVFETTTAVSLQIAKIVAGVGTLLGTISLGTYLPNQFWRTRFQGKGPQLRVKSWIASLPEPAAWMLTVTDTSLVTGNQVGVSSRFNTGNLNGGGIVPWDNLLVIDECAPCEPVTVDTSDDPTTLESDGTFWLRDPVRPCHDRNVPLCFTQASLAEIDGEYCIPGEGIFFASMDTERYNTNTFTLNTNNAKYPIAISRQRRGVTSTLQLVSRTFADRDALLTLADPGSPLFWQGPANYGIPDQYMDVGVVSVARGLTDHRFQVRVNDLPYTQVARPAGPSQGICGSQVSDYCEFTWAELVAGGFTWDNLIQGTPTGGTPGYRTWNDVLADFADWNAVNDGTRTWTGLETGL